MIIIFIVYNYGSHYSNTRPPTPYKHSHPQLCVKNIRLAVENTTGNREKGGENYKIIFENHDVLPRPVVVVWILLRRHCFELFGLLCPAIFRCYKIRFQFQFLPDTKSLGKKCGLVLKCCAHHKLKLGTEFSSRLDQDLCGIIVNFILLYPNVFPIEYECRN